MLETKNRIYLMKLENFTNRNFSKLITTIRFGMIPVLMLLVSWNVSAQNCPLACNDHVQVSLDSDCSVAITPDMMLEGQGTDPLCTYTVTVLGSDNLPIVGSPVVTGIHIGKTLTVRVWLGQNSCWGTIKIEDKMPPFIECPDDITLNCYDARTFPLPLAFDNCTNNPTVKLLSNDVTDLGCGDDYTAVRTIRYQATDASGNKSAICERLIYYDAVSIGDVVFPDNKDDVEDPVLECDNIPLWDLNNNGYPDVAETGGPTIDGISIYPNNSLCELNATFTDQRIDICANSFKILRHWFVLDWCTGEILTDYQIIKVLDREPPIVTCVPDSPNAASADPYNCYATWQVPPPIVVYDCGATTYTVAYLLATSNGQPPVNGIYITDNVRKVGNIYFIDKLPVGRTWIRYTVTDACGNYTYCFTEIDVIDNVPPVAVCDEFTVVTLTTSSTTGGVAQIFATTFDDGSHDNCTAVTFDARRITPGCGASTVNWTQAVNFCCADVGKDIMVALRVSDKNNNTNSCMVIVRVQDKIDPIITCPANVTVQCNDPIDPAHTGTATVVDNCSNLTPTFTDGGTLSQCGVGTIIRTWRATDPGGKTVSCNQTIVVLDNDPFGLSDINWGPVFGVKELNGCIDVDTDPSVTGSPTWTSDDCSLIASTYNDQLFTFVDGACFKIIRTWTIIDWCTFNQNNPNYGGIWQYTQVIKLNNTVKPVFENCTNRVFCAYGENCNGQIDLIQIASDDCTPLEKLVWTYQVDYGNNGSIDRTGVNNNASGVYPVGIHKIRWTVEDKCGNKTVCEYLITVNDCKKPTPYCYGEITTVIMPVSGSVDIWASDFDLGSYDNCPGTLKISFSTNVNDTKRIFTCNDLGINDLQMWVTDAAGNKEFCSVKINIQANGAACGGNRIVGGKIATEGNHAMPALEVKMLEGFTNESFSALTTQDGSFKFVGMKDEQNYQVSTSLDKDHNNGVSSLDLVLIQRHILGTAKLNSPYKVIASDANGSGTITAADLVDIRKLILGVNTKFPGNKSWRFVDGSQVFADANKPWPFNEAITLQYKGEDLVNNNFKAVKIGDVNESALAGLNAASAEPRTNQKLTFVAENQIFDEGQKVVVPVRAADAASITGFQYTLMYDNNQLSFEGVESGVLDMTEENVGRMYANKGMVTASWINAQSQTMKKDEVLYTLIFTAKTNGTLTQSLALSSVVTTAEAYNQNLEIMNLSLEVRDQNASEIVVKQNTPNPFDDQTSINFTLPKRADVTLTVFDITGKTVYTATNPFEKGHNTIRLSADQLSTSGILYYQFEAGDFKTTKKMILIKK